MFKNCMIKVFCDQRDEKNLKDDENNQKSMFKQRRFQSTLNN